MTDKQLVMRLAELYGWKVEEANTPTTPMNDSYRFTLSDGFWMTVIIEYASGHIAESYGGVRPVINTLVQRSNQLQKKGQQKQKEEK